MQTALILFFTFALIYCLQKLLAYLSAIRSVKNIPGYRVFLSPTNSLGYILPKIPVICIGNNHFFEDKHAPFESAGWDVTSIVSSYPKDEPILVLADAAAIKEVTTARARFPKPAREYEVVSIYGPSIVSCEGEEWKKYRNISAPAFSHRNNKLVWDETIKIMNELFNEVWAGKDVISLDNTLELTLAITLFVIGGAAFGQKTSWNEDTVVPKGHQMSMNKALHIVSTGTFFRILFPDWILKLTKRLDSIKVAFEELQMYMSEMIDERQNSNSDIERHDIFSNFITANNENVDTTNLTKSEIIGNIYMFLLAGQETTGNTLCFAFGLLALYPDEQEKLYKNIVSVLPDRRNPTFEDMPLLTYALCVFYETLRMFPPVINIPKLSEEDTVLTIGNAANEKLTIPIPKGVRITIDTPGLHYNPRYWKDPHSFKPARFLEDWPKDAFLPFSAGPRGCLGRKFSETEAIATLTMLVSQYKITVKEEPQFVGETFEQRKIRVLKCWNGLTLTPSRIPLTFTRRV